VANHVCRGHQKWGIGRQDPVHVPRGLFAVSLFGGKTTPLLLLLLLLLGRAAAAAGGIIGRVALGTGERGCEYLFPLHHVASTLCGCLFDRTCPETDLSANSAQFTVMELIPLVTMSRFC